MLMAPKSPKDAVGQLVTALNSGNLDAAVSLYEPAAVLVAQPGKLARGTTALREALGAFIALNPTLVTRREQFIEADGVALYTSDWTLTGTDPTGKPLEMRGRSSDVLRRRSDGSWSIAVDNPWGPSVLD
jgi:ketosteroid isomerase-like protein